MKIKIESENIEVDVDVDLTRPDFEWHIRVQIPHPHLAHRLQKAKKYKVLAPDEDTAVQILINRLSRPNLFFNRSDRYVRSIKKGKQVT